MYGHFDERNVDIQIRIENLMDFHGKKYPLSWYEGLSDSQIKGMYSEAMSKYAQRLQGAS